MRLRSGAFRLDTSRWILTRDGQTVSAQPKVLDLLFLLLHARGDIVAREAIERALWPDVRVGEASLHQALRRLRRTLGGVEDHVEAVPRRGWRWSAPVTEERDNGLVGRDLLFVDIHGALLPGAFVALRGPPAVGKTAVARAAAPESVFVSLLGAATVGEVVRRVAAAIQVPPDADPEQALVHALGAVDRTVLLDDADGAAPFLAALVKDWSNPNLRLLATARTVVPGAVSIEVQPLRPPDDGALLEQALGRPLPDPVRTELAAAMHGLPGALLLAAARLRVLSPEVLLARSKAHPVAVPGVEDSILRLSEGARAVLGACAEFPGAFEASHVEALGSDGDGALDSLTELVDASLVIPAPSGFVVPGYVRDAAATIDSPLARRWVGAVAARAATEFEGALRWVPSALERLGAQVDDLVAAAGVDAHPDVAAGLAFGSRYIGPWQTAEQALAAVPKMPPLVRLLYAEYALRMHRKPLARSLLMEPAPDLEAFRAFLIARSHVAEGAFDAALASAAEAVELAAEAGNSALVALSWDVAGTTHGLRGEPDRAVECFDVAFSWLAHPDGALVRLIVAQNGAATLARLGREEEAVVRLGLALEAGAGLQAPHLQRTVRGNYAAALLACGRAEEALPILDQALTSARSVGDRMVAAHRAADLALARLLTGDLDGARVLFDEANAGPTPTSAFRALLAERNGWWARAAGRHAEAQVFEDARRALGPSPTKRHPALQARITALDRTPGA